MFAEPKRKERIDETAAVNGMALKVKEKETNEHCITHFKGIQ